MKIEHLDKVIPLIKEFDLPDETTLYKALKGYIVLSTVRPGKVGNVIFSLAKKEANRKITYRILRYFKTFGDVGIEADFFPENMDQAVEIVFNRDCRDCPYNCVNFIIA